MGLTSDVKAAGAPKEILTGVVTLGAGGAIASQSCEGFTVTKTAAEVGRYTVAPATPYTSIEYAHGVLEITADAAAVQAKGVACVLRGVSPSTRVAYLQFTTTPTAGAAGADAEPEDNAKIRIVVVAKKGRLR